MLSALVLDAVMESHRIRVNKEELERTSALLGVRHCETLCTLALLHDKPLQAEGSSPSPPDPG